MSRDKINVERASARACSVGTKGYRRWVRYVSGEMTSTVVWKLGQYEPFRLKVIMKIKVQINRFVIDQRLCGESRSEQLHCISLTFKQWKYLLDVDVGPGFYFSPWTYTSPCFPAFTFLYSTSPPPPPKFLRPWLILFPSASWHHGSVPDSGGDVKSFEFWGQCLIAKTSLSRIPDIQKLISSSKHLLKRCPDHCSPLAGSLARTLAARRRSTGKTTWAGGSAGQDFFAQSQLIA